MNINMIKNIATGIACVALVGAAAYDFYTTLRLWKDMKRVNDAHEAARAGLRSTIQTVHETTTKNY